METFEQFKQLASGAYHAVKSADGYIIKSIKPLPAKSWYTKVHDTPEEAWQGYYDAWLRLKTRSK